ncbi:rhodanese-like domain-containing protein [Gluconacetobacter liquefaciens]|uniref:Rhodanese-like domain-containing protein n=1 Tax=Gluconacetobacter liquefaciens TaxID=89584 RepID=A0A370FZA6_GLULI|nr:rhodanese-like domain-containing protein [Gluconacetobacter liquefaciens]MBB2187979.1 rhodanese-like domain-containing protein [Gluconacetobacter liquefaciens]RDI36280.1 rhodanese-related sulfurtransferase [Gluconacetobacter liquefaciens]GBQ97357.1 rhodanese [Gluconacetobacter liquefaciens NRIC 0522]GEB39467.1 rhodanese-like domain-containing protein [Gluconacetobacter liquefaciens]
MASSVTTIPPAPSAEAVAYFSALFGFETDCWDVHAAMAGQADFVLLDVRGPDLFARGHIAGALNIPHGKITAARMAVWSGETVFVTYCAGPHCNGAARGALRLARLGRPVKIMIGGVAGWVDEGFTLQDVPHA